MKKRIVNFLIVFSLVVSILPVGTRVKAIENSQEENRFGYIDDYIKIYEQKTTEYLFAAFNMPSRFDLREEEGVTSIKNQNPYGTCWTFASMSAVESNFKYTTGKEIDLSEINLAIDRVGIDGLDRGGNFSMATSYFANDNGPVLEKDDPYPTYGQVPVKRNVPATYNVQNSMFLPARTGPLDNDKIKQTIMDNGAVGISYYHSSSYLATDGMSYYNSVNTNSNHAVTLVGWDDNYPKEKFNNTPAGNGAFIVKNSWGNWFGENGYFYISYYDTSLGNNLILTTNNTETLNDVDNRYTYGNHSISYYYGSESTYFSDQFIANVHVAKNNELLNELSIYTFSTNVAYEVYIDENYDEANYPNGDVTYLLGKKKKNSTLQYAGLNTIKLDSLVEVQAGKRFIVAVKYKDGTSPNLTYIDSAGSSNSFKISNNKLNQKGYANALTVYSYNKVSESATGMNIDKTSLALKIGEKSQINASVIGNTLTSKKVNWTSSNTKVAVVDEDGVVTGRGNGNAIITVSSRSGNVKRTINVSLNTNLSMLNSFDVIDRNEKYLSFDEAITPGLDFSKITLKDQNGNTMPISTRVDGKRLYVKLDTKFLGHGNLYIPQNAVVNKVNRGLSSDQSLRIIANSYNDTDIVTLGSKSLMQAIASTLGKSENQITSVDLPKIKNISLEGADIDFNGISLLTSLITLNVDCTNGNVINIKDLQEVRSIKYLDFNGVNMPNLNYIRNNTNLVNIALNSCKLYSLEGIENLTNVTQATFSDNYISDIKGIGKLNKLTSLGLGDNRITDISELGSCSELNYLSVYGNKLTNLNGVQSLTKLTSLNAGYNFINDLKELQNCKSINFMNFNNNEISDLTPVKTLSDTRTRTDLPDIYISENHINSDNVISKYLTDTKGWGVNNYNSKLDLYEINDFKVQQNSMDSRSDLTLTFNREINNSWNINIYQYDENYNAVYLPYKIDGNRILIENKMYSAGEQSDYYLYFDVEYVDNNGNSQDLYSSISMSKTGFYLEDVNKDQVIDINDIAQVALSYNQMAKGNVQNWQYNKDINLDGIIDIYDLVAISRTM